MAFLWQPETAAFTKSLSYLQVTNHYPDHNGGAFRASTDTSKARIGQMSAMSVGRRGWALNPSMSPCSMNSL